MKFLKQGTYIKYVIEKLSKFIQILAQISFYSEFFEI